MENICGQTLFPARRFHASCGVSPARLRGHFTVEMPSGKSRQSRCEPRTERAIRHMAGADHMTADTRRQTGQGGTFRLSGSPRERKGQKYVRRRFRESAPPASRAFRREARNHYLREAPGRRPEYMAYSPSPAETSAFPFLAAPLFSVPDAARSPDPAGHACGQPHGRLARVHLAPPVNSPLCCRDPAFHVGTYPAVQAAIRTAQQIDMPDPFLHVLPVSRNGTKINPHLSGARESGFPPDILQPACLPEDFMKLPFDASMSAAAASDAFRRHPLTFSSTCR